MVRQLFAHCLRNLVAGVAKLVSVVFESSYSQFCQLCADHVGRSICLPNSEGDAMNTVSTFRVGIGTLIGFLWLANSMRMNSTTGIGVFAI